MRVSDIIAEVAEAVGKCVDDAGLFKRITRGVELLANKQLVDPLLATYEFSTAEGYFVALPRDCKTVLKVNINDTPSFSRSRLFEFQLNTDGTVGEAEENGMSWRDWGYLPIQDEKKLPGVLTYKATNAADGGKTATVFGRDEDGREISETVTASSGTPTAGSLTFHKIHRVFREATAYECSLLANSEVVAQYYGDETEPEYRIIKLSKNPASVRVLYRKRVFALTTLDDFIPLDSQMAVVYAAKAAAYYAQDEDAKADAALARAVMFQEEEQRSRDEHNELAAASEIPTATDTIFSVRDGIVVGDVYDVAANVFGPVGRRKLLDHITTAFEVLRNKAHWDASLGWVDVYLPDNEGAVTHTSATGHGYFVLPRFVEAPISVNLIKQPMIPRNKWFEYHLNSFGERDTSPVGAWDDCGEVCITRPLALDPDEDADVRRIKPVKVVAVPDDSADNETSVRIYGQERLADGRDVEVRRNNELGWLCPCVAGSYNPGADAPDFTAIDRIVTAEHTGFIKLRVTAEVSAVWTLGVELGNWYPDETEPKYRMVKLPTSKARRIRVLYRKRATKFTSLLEPVQLRSRLAIESMLRSLKARETDLAAALQYEADAKRLLAEERINSGPSDTAVMQFDYSVMAGVTGQVA